MPKEAPFIPSPEQREKSSYKQVIVYRMRHGDTNYYEHTHESDDWEKHDLKEEGIESMKANARIIAEQHKTEKDDVIFCVVASPRVRAQNGKRIIEKELAAAGFNVWDDARTNKPQKMVRSLDISDENGEDVPTKDERHPDFFNAIQAELKSDESGYVERLAQHGIKNLETLESVSKRTRHQLSKFFRIARTIQPKVGKRIIVIEIEHGETLDDSMEQVSFGERTMKKGTEAQKGEMIKIDIPVDPGKNEMEVAFSQDEGFGEEKKIDYDPDKKEF